MIDVFIYDGIRTPFGRHAGALAAVRPDALLTGMVATLIARSPYRGEDVEDVIVGCTNQAGEDCRSVARRAGLLAGLPVEVAGITVNRLCASGLVAVVDASRLVACEQGDLFIAGVVESMSRPPPALVVYSLVFINNLMVRLTHYGTTTSPVIFIEDHVTFWDWWWVGSMRRC